ncbi:MAG: PH domain-containing protein [Micromonosporaceae bacterium]|nr:PH domain-containing protein [Micromonosporaceae bacterium]
MVIRPRRLRRICWVLAPVVAIFFAVLGALLRGPIGGAPTSGVFQGGDQVAMVVLGLLAAGAILLFTRPRVVADTRHIEVRNVLGTHDVPWAVVRRIVFERGNPWVSLELEDDDLLAVMAVQAADKEHAVAAVRSLRALHAAARDAVTQDAAARDAAAQDANAREATSARPADSPAD